MEEEEINGGRKGRGKGQARDDEGTEEEEEEEGGGEGGKIRRRWKGVGIRKE
jgi:hypothetical protein